MAKNYDIDNIIEGEKLFLIAGPCVIESKEVCFTVAEKLIKMYDKYYIPVIFKSSYTKANRLSGESFSGYGIEFGLNILGEVSREFDFPTLTDIHETSEAIRAAEVVDIIQIPAFLCRQTELVREAALTGRWINIKKGQFLSPDDMDKIAAKARSGKVLLTERGSSFGYHNLVVDFRSLIIMKNFGFPIVFDATHSLQLPGGGGKFSSGQPQFIIPFAKAATAIGINGLFVETHPDPKAALSDAAAMLPLENMETLITEVKKISEARQ